MIIIIYLTSHHHHTIIHHQNRTPMHSPQRTMQTSTFFAFPRFLLSSHPLCICGMGLLDCKWFAFIIEWVWGDGSVAGGLLLKAHIHCIRNQTLGTILRNFETERMQFCGSARATLWARLHIKQCQVHLKLIDISHHQPNAVHRERAYPGNKFQFN